MGHTMNKHFYLTFPWGYSRSSNGSTLELAIDDCERASEATNTLVTLYNRQSDAPFLLGKPIGQTNHKGKFVHNGAYDE